MNIEFRDWLESEIQYLEDFESASIVEFRILKKLERTIRKYDELHKPVVIPEYVAEYLEFAKDKVKLMKVLEEAYTRDELHEWKKVYDWISANDEVFARAWLDGYEVEEEQKYYVDLYTAAYVAKWQGDDQVGIYSDGVSGSDEHEFHLTEQEIKDFDPRYWPFAVKVEEDSDE